jgi:voltage-gated potassium channel Kch
MIAELSFPSTGLGIEIGYADIYKVPIIIIVKSGITISSSARVLATHIIEYSTISELVQNLKLVLKQIVTEKNTA